VVELLAREPVTEMTELFGGGLEQLLALLGRRVGLVAQNAVFGVLSRVVERPRTELPAAVPAGAVQISGTGVANSMKAPTRSTIRDSLCSSLTAFVAVLASSGVARTGGPFRSARRGVPGRGFHAGQSLR